MKSLNLFVIILLFSACASYKQRSASPEVEPIKVKYSGKIIRETMVRYVPQMKACYQEGLNNQDKAFGGKVAFNFVISPTGNILKALVNPVEGKMPESVRKCLQSQLTMAKFPLPHDGKSVQAVQVINFEPQS